MVFYCEFNNINEAISFEKQVKGWSRKKKEAIIKNNWHLLPSLSICQNESHHKNFEKDKIEKGFDSAQPDKSTNSSK